MSPLWYCSPATAVLDPIAMGVWMTRDIEVRRLNKTSFEASLCESPPQGEQLIPIQEHCMCPSNGVCTCNDFGNGQ